MTRRPLVVVTDVTDIDPAVAERLLEERGYAVLRLERDREAVLERAGDVVALIVGFASVGAETFDLFPGLRLACTWSVGTDMVDARAAAERGIRIVGLQDVSTEEVATHALALLLSAARGVPAGTETVRRGGWTAENAYAPRALSGLTLGILGYGRIGRKLAALAAPLFARILVHDPVAPAGSLEGAARSVGFEELLSASDVLSLHLPLTEGTHGAIDAAALALLPDGALLVNVSRAEIVDEAAVIGALDAGRLSWYVADVLDGEPPAAEAPLRVHRRAIVTPHVGFLSDASLRRYESGPAEAVVAALG